MRETEDQAEKREAGDRVPKQEAEDRSVTRETEDRTAQREARDRAAEDRTAKREARDRRKEGDGAPHLQEAEDRGGRRPSRKERRRPSQEERETVLPIIYPPIARGDSRSTQTRLRRQLPDATSLEASAAVRRKVA